MNDTVGIIATASGLILTIFGFVLTIWQIRKLSETIFFDQVRGAFFDICTIPQLAVIPLEELYKSILKYHENVACKEPNQIRIDLDYLNFCLPRHLDVRFKRTSDWYDFPLVSLAPYLLSKNDKLQIRYGSFNFDKVQDSNLLDAASKRFLDQLGIKNLSSFIARGKKIWDQWTFDLERMEFDERNNILNLHFIRGSYFQYVNRNELLSRESFFQYHLKKGNLIKAGGFGFKHKFPKENSARDLASKKCLFDFSNKATSVGFHIFIIMHKGDGRFCTFVQKRGSMTVEYPGYYHVVPAGTFQPLSEFDAEIVKAQCNFAFTVVREFLEEVFDMEKTDKFKGVNPFRIFSMEAAEGFSPGSFLFDNEDEINNPQLVTKNYQIIPTGFCIDLMTLKPQLSFVLVIKNSSLYKRASEHFQGNWEGHIKEYDLEDPQFNFFLERTLNVKHVPPAGAVTFAEGVHYYHSHKADLLENCF